MIQGGSDEPGALPGIRRDRIARSVTRLHVRLGGDPDRTGVRAGRDRRWPVASPSPPGAPGS